MDPKYLGELIEEWKTLGPVRFAAQNRDAMLQLRDLGKDDEADDANFHTAFMNRDELQEATSATAGGSGEHKLPSLSVGQVVRVAKRQGGAFQDRIGVGRARNVDVPLPLAKMSKYHAFFSKSDDGRSYSVTDAGSTNGTFLDGKRLPEKQAVPLSDGQEIAFGPYRFTFYTPDGFVEMVKRRAALR